VSPEYAPQGDVAADLAGFVAELEALRSVQHRLLLLPLLGEAGRAAAADEGATSGPEEWLVRALLDLRAALLTNPVAGQRLFAFLVAEGRRFAGTDEGGRWLTALAGDPLVERLRRVWEATSLNVFDEQPSGVPAAWTQLISDALAVDVLDRAARAIRPPGLA
jgi:hypothetical protein